MAAGQPPAGDGVESLTGSGAPAEGDGLADEPADPAEVEALEVDIQTDAEGTGWEIIDEPLAGLVATLPAGEQGSVALTAPEGDPEGKESACVTVTGAAPNSVVIVTVTEGETPPALPPQPEPVPAGGVHTIQDNVTDPENPRTVQAEGITVQDNVSWADEEKEEDRVLTERTVQADGTTSDHRPLPPVDADEEPAAEDE